MRAPQPATPSIPIINRLNLLRIKVYFLLKCNIKGIGKKPSHYTGIKLDGLIIALCPKLCQHNSSDPNGQVSANDISVLLRNIYNVSKI